MRLLCFSLVLLCFCVPNASEALASDIVVVVDSSGSMQEQTPDGLTRIEAAKRALLQLPPLLSNHEVGMILFGHRASTRATACSDIELRLPVQQFSAPEFQLAVAALRPHGATPLAKALEAAGEVLKDRPTESPKAVILVTDGNETCGGDPAYIARQLAEAGINLSVHVVGFGVTADQEIQLKAIAESGSGRYLLAQDSEQLSQAIPKIVQAALRKTLTKEVARRELIKETFSDENLAGWKIVNPDLERCAAIDDELIIITQHTDDENDNPHIGDWHDDAKIKNLVQTNDPILAPDFEVTVDLSLQITSLGQGAALQLQAEDGRTIELAYMAHPWGNNIVRRFTMSKIMSDHIVSTRFDQETGAAQQPEAMRLRIIKRGIVFTGHVEIADPETGEVKWREVGTQAMPGFERAYPTLKAANGWQNLPEATAIFDNFQAVETVLEHRISDSVPDNAVFYTTFEDPSDFQDNFSIRNPSATHWGLQGGLNVVSQFGVPGDEENPLKNLILLDQELPQGDYSIEVQARTRLTNQNSDVGIALFQDAETGMYLGHSAFGQGGYNYHPQFHFEKVLGGERSGTKQAVQHVQGKEITVLFKIEKRGRKYTGSVYAPDEDGEMTWLPIGEQAILRFAPKLALYAWNRSADTYGRGPAHEVNICFERIVIRELK